MPVGPISDRIEAWLAQTTGRWSFGDPARTVARLYAFSLAEDGTMIELEAAANATTDPMRAAAYLRHAADESRHARMFIARARAIAAAHQLPAPPSPAADASALFATLGEVDFLAFIHRGEAKGRARFEGWARVFQAAGDAQTASLFATLVIDERRHEQDAWRMLVEVAGERGASRALLRMAAYSAWQRYLRAARAVSHLLYRGLLWAAFPLLWPLGIWTRRALPERTGWLQP